MKKPLRTLFMFWIFTLGFLASKLDLSCIKGPTKTYKISGITRYNVEYGSPVFVQGIKEDTKEVFKQYLPSFYEEKLFKDVPKGQPCYVTWKENNLARWDIEIHIREDAAE